MRRTIRLVRAIRPGALFFSVPYTLLWARSLPDMRALTGWLIVALHAAGLLLTLALLSVSSARRAGPPALGVDRDPLGADADSLRLIAGVLALACAGLLIALTPAAFRVSLAGAVLLALALWQPLRAPRRRWLGFEAGAPFVALVAPALLLGQRGWTAASARAPVGATPPTTGLEGVPLAHAGAPMPASALGATLLGAVAMGLFILLCFSRDSAADRRAGVETTATRLGPGLTRAMLSLWLVGAVTLACIGSAGGWWGWGVPLLSALGAMAVSAALARDDLEAGARRWWWAHAAIALALCVTTRVSA